MTQVTLTANGIKITRTVDEFTFQVREITTEEIAEFAFKGYKTTRAYTKNLTASRGKRVSYFANALIRGNWPHGSGEFNWSVAETKLLEAMMEISWSLLPENLKDTLRDVFYRRTNELSTHAKKQFINYRNGCVITSNRGGV